MPQLSMLGVTIIVADIKINARKEAKIKNPFTGKYLELDIWIPTLHISFEFQDPYHYVTTWDSNIPLEVVQAKDNILEHKIMNTLSLLIVNTVEEECSSTTRRDFDYCPLLVEWCP